MDWSNFDAQKLAVLAQKNKGEHQTLVKRLKKMNPRKLDELVHDLHVDVFDEIDCLDCANCCKSLGPRITEKDIERLGKALRLKSAEVIQQYLRIDEDDDFVFRSMPCPFLMDDNYCMVYESRPKACREYPHTDRKKFYQLLQLSLKNTATCPAVFEVFEALKDEVK